MWRSDKKEFFLTKEGLFVDKMEYKGYLRPVKDYVE